MAERGTPFQELLDRFQALPDVERIRLLQKNRKAVRQEMPWLLKELDKHLRRMREAA